MTKISFNVDIQIVKCNISLDAFALFHVLCPIPIFVFAMLYITILVGIKSLPIECTHTKLNLTI